MDNLTIVIPFYNGHETIKRLLDSLPPGLPVLIVDDQSEKPLALRRKGVTVIRPETKGYFTGAVNAGLRACTTDVLILNQDVHFENTGWLDLIERNRARCGLIGERIGGNHPAWPKGYIHGTFMFVRRDVIDRVGPMNARDYPLWGSTCEYQLRACRAGFEALPLQQVPGFVHERQGNYGSSIQQLLKEQSDRRGLFIRTPPMISVVITCYNYGRYLSDAVNSLIGGKTGLGQMPGQTFQSFEIVIIDDGSTDETPEIGRKLADDWKGIRYIRQENRGSAAACNAGVRASHGKYIAILDADDMMQPWRLEEMYRLSQANPHSVIYDDISEFAGNHITRSWSMRDYDFDDLVYRNGMHKGLLFPKAAWQEAGGYPEVMNKGREDWAFNVALGLKGWCGVRLPKNGYLYRREGQNRTLINTTKAWRTHFFQQLRGIFPDLYQRGIKPMGCCGSGANAPKNGGGGGAARTTKALRDLPGKVGMVTLEYIGPSASDMDWYGPVTGTRYYLGGVRKRGYVDKRDVLGMKELKENGRRLFKEYQPPKPVVRPEPLPVELPAEPEPVVIEQAVEPELETLTAEVVTVEPEPVKPARKTRGRGKKSNA